MKKLITLLFLVFCVNAQSQTRIILEKSNGIYYIPCQVNGLNMKFIFDSGASAVTISLTEALFMVKNNYLSIDNILGTEYYQLANGEIQEGTKIILNSINIGGYEIKNVEASIIHNMKAPLLLGQSALSKLGKFSFDYSNNSLIISNDNSYNYTYGCVSGICLNGYGTYTFPDGDKYVGEWKDGKYNGQGTYTFSNGNKYVGEFKDDKYNGQGTLTSNGGKYVGEFKDDKYNGQGTLTFPSREKYVGEFKDGEYNGQGTYTLPDGAKYVGEWKDYKYNGQGTFTFSNGGIYVGEWKDGKQNGQGTYTIPSGEKYVGEWKDGKYNGQGTLTFPDGEKYIGYFSNGTYVGQE